MKNSSFANKIRAIGVAAVLVLALSGVALADSPEGKWSAPGGTFIVRLNRCGENLCGYLIALREPTYAGGKKKIDRHNENKSLRGRPLIGLALLSEMRPTGQDSWKGKIYNPDDGHTYNATIKLRSGAMQLQGCVAGILCKAQKFVRTN
jgi:uncharacterized protein (DUF2147 family)